jgi:uncharacterized membrane protein
MPSKAPTPPKPEPEKPSSASTLTQVKALIKDERAVPMLIYALLFFMAMSMGFAGVLALVLIYLNQDDATELTKSHYIFQKNTFWYGIGAIITCLILGAIGVPFLPMGIFVIAFFWIVIRATIGYNHLLHMRPHPDPKTLLA